MREPTEKKVHNSQPENVCMHFSDAFEYVKYFHKPSKCESFVGLKWQQIPTMEYRKEFDDFAASIS